MADLGSKSKSPNPNPDWQDKDIKVRWLAIFLGLILGTAVATMVGMGVLFSRYETQLRAADVPISPLALERTVPQDVPKLQVRPQDELALHRAAEDAFLNHYQWVDRDLGIVRIPVDRAMSILAERGLPARGQQ